MRFRKLGLRRYGKFTDAVIDFGERPVGAPDLHIVYGPNEAGKSTALSACMDLFYGIHPQSRFNFLHPYPTMRIEADLEILGTVRSFSRLKLPHNSLLDDAGNPAADAVLLGELGGLDRNAYQTMFCLDDATLEAGGESILASKGDLGHLLFSATAGLADLSERLGSARAEAEGFFRSGKRSGILVELKKELAALKEERDRIDTLASEYSRLVIERDEASSAYTEALVQRGRTQARVDEVQRFINALPRLQTLRSLRAELLPLASLPDVPSTWTDDLPALMFRQTKLATQTQTVTETIGNLRHELERLVVNASACGLQNRIELLTELRARYVTAEKDLPDRRLRLGSAEQTVARVLARIDHASEQDPARLVLPAAVTGPLRDLMERRSGVEAALATAETEVDKALEALSEAEARIDDRDGGFDETTTGALTAAIAMARQADDVARSRAADRICRERADELGDRLIELLPWTGDRNTLCATSVPAQDQLQRWASVEADLSLEIASRQGEEDRLAAEARRLDTKIDALRSVVGVVSDNDAGEARTAREAAWAIHKAELHAETAVTFEAAMRRLDLITEQRFSHTARVAELNSALLERAEARAALEQTGRELQASLRKRAELAEEIENALRAIGHGLEMSIGLAGLSLWIRKRDRAIEANGKLLAAERECREAKIETDGTRERIAKAMRSAGVDISEADDIAAMLAAGQAALDRAVDAKNLRATIGDRRRDLSFREKRLGDARLAEEAWSRDWQEVCATCWLGQREIRPATAVVRETLEALSELESTLEKRTELTDRIAKMQRDQIQFRTEVDALAASTELSPSSDTLGLCQAVMDCIATAAKTTDRRREVESRLAVELGRAGALADETAEMQAQASLMMGHFGVGSLMEVDACLRALARRSDLEARSIEVRNELLEGTQAETIEQAETILEKVDRGSLEAEMIVLKSRFEDEDARSRDLFSARNRADDKISAVGGDAAVAILEGKRRTVLLTIEDKALAYLRLKLGTAAADRALRAYRDRHRSSMMTRASESFALISRGAYSELVTQPSNGSELLIAKGSDGSSKIASELSKGTRFQLYLALRVAGYHEFARAQVPPPFLADDIMETFDDFRAEEAFRLLAGMAATGQVVYFTHHRHLCEIAMAVEPTAIVHDLQSGTRVRVTTRAA
ncbi:AAA family ATPase [Bradyrhizobium sp. Ash2021]|uniref:ATP-binding protein n=1 Tax=Bradyrhizobium sp. Ash2021 TaxID=2954771 RepID=UPI002815533B|nr:AAA family ATPase [Bradyrhizobium sp. Ash2021]WMT76298.1 AAA family ATPase [Bradyrhizobium sp. Ash2021]